MKKGFTLVELLAVIVILALLLAIAIPTISSIVTNSRNQAYIEDQKMLIKASKNYFAVNSTLLPTNVGDTLQLTLNDLKNGGFIGGISDPNTSSISCNGYVLVTKTDTSNYEYVPHLKCGDENGIGSSVNDGLIAHYTFDTFKEYTSNLTNDPTFTASILTNGSGGNFGNWSFNTWSGFIHEKLSPEVIGVGSAIKIYGNSGITGPNDMWDLGWRDNTISGKTYTISFYAKGSGNIRVANHWGGTTFSVNLTTDYRRYSFTFVKGATGYFWIQTAGLTTGQWVQFEGFQVEEKAYVTPFVSGIRNDIVIDSSTYSHDATLTFNTPVWGNSGPDYTGAYEFNGTSQYISVPNHSDFNLTSGATISLWAKARSAYPSVDSNVKYQGMVSKSSSGSSPGLAYWIDWYGSNTTRTLRFGIGDGISTQIATQNDFNFNGKWALITASYDGTKIKLYINGKKVDEKAQTIIPQVVNIPLEIGRAFSGSSYNFDGWIDDVRIYNRMLSDYAIQKIYDTNPYVNQ